MPDISLALELIYCYSILISSNNVFQPNINGNNNYNNNIIINGEMYNKNEHN